MKFNSSLVSVALLFAASAEAFSPSQLNQRMGFSKTTSTSTSTSTSGNDDTNTHSRSRSQTGRSHGRWAVVLFAKVGIFFGSSTGSTEGVADMIAAEFGDDAEGPFEIDELQGSVAKKFGEFDALIVGTPTWNTGADTERSGTGWDEIYYGEMQDLQMEGKKVAVFGLGDQISYGENYADASGELHDVFENLGCKLMGYTSQDGYEHEDSKAIRGDKFCGLLCDEVNQDDLSEERVQNWVAQLKAEGVLEGGSTVTSTPVEVVSSPVTTNVSAPPSDLVTELELENARLRAMLEDSKVMDDILKAEVLDQGYAPHFNPRTRVTMWTSADGRDCYYTKDAPKSP